MLSALRNTFLVLKLGGCEPESVADRSLLWLSCWYARRTALSERKGDSWHQGSCWTPWVRVLDVFESFILSSVGMLSVLKLGVHSLFVSRWSVYQLNDLSI